MKTRTILLASALCMAVSMQAQAPQKFNYQGIARTGAGAPMVNQTLGLEITILNGTTAQYVERHTATTNGIGLYTVQIGGGTAVTGTMGAVTWSAGNKNIKVGIDPNGGTNYTDMGTTELLSVPYALYAAEGSQGPQGDPGPTGATGPQGPQGVPGAEASGWGLNGNDAADSSFIGTTNDQDLRFKRNGEGVGLVANENTSLGLSSLSSLTTGTSNTGFGAFALQENTTGVFNTAIGDLSMSSNTIGNTNTAAGSNSLTNNTAGSLNVALGTMALRENTTGSLNSAVGSYSMDQNTTGEDNVALGAFALRTNTTGTHNTGIGYRTEVGSADLNNATAIGANAYVTQSNSLVLGSINGVNDAHASTKVGIGTTAPSAALEVQSAGSVPNPQLLLRENSTDPARLFFQNSLPGGWLLSGKKGNDAASSLFSFYYSQMPAGGGEVLSISGQGKIGINTGSSSTDNTYGTLGIRSTIFNRDNLTLYNSTADTRWGFWVGPTSTPFLKLYLNGNEKGYFSDVSGAYSSTSDIRLKENIAPVNNVLDQIKGIEVMHYTFKADANHQPQLGYIAQNLEEHFPEFVNKPDTTSGKESCYTVNYAGMSAVAIKAIQEQQAMIESLQQALAKVQARLDQLEK